MIWNGYWKIGVDPWAHMTGIFSRALCIWAVKLFTILLFWLDFFFLVPSPSLHREIEYFGFSFEKNRSQSRGLCLLHFINAAMPSLFCNKCASNRIKKMGVFWLVY